MDVLRGADWHGEQKIADEVLHMSKISMNLLVLSKIDFQPKVEIANVLRMFEVNDAMSPFGVCRSGTNVFVGTLKVEVKAKKLNLLFSIEDGFKALAVDWVRGDPTRLAQVL